MGLEKVYQSIVKVDKDMTELGLFNVRRVSYSSVSCIRDQRVPASRMVKLSLTKSCSSSC